jgi:hypothetical protein
MRPVSRDCVHHQVVLRNTLKLEAPGIPAHFLIGLRCRLGWPSIVRPQLARRGIIPPKVRLVLFELRIQRVDEPVFGLARLSDDQKTHRRSCVVQKAVRNYPSTKPATSSSNGINDFHCTLDVGGIG